MALSWGVASRGGLPGCDRLAEPNPDAAMGGEWRLPGLWRCATKPGWGVLHVEDG